MTASKTALKGQTDQLPINPEDYEDYAGAGFENQTQDDYSIPFLHILQSNSPQVEEDENLRQGMIINTVTGEVFEGKSEGVAFIPAVTEHVYVEWVPRDSGGGFVGVFQPGDPVVKRAISESSEYGKYSTPDGNDLIETFYVYGILIGSEGEPQQAVIAFSSSKIKKYKAWQTKAKTIQIQLPDGRRIPAPLFSHRYRLKTVGEKNAKGSFANWDIAFDGENAQACRIAPKDPLFQSAVAIRDLLAEGKARAAYESQVPEAGGEGNGAEGGAAGGAPSEGKPKF